MKFTCEKSTLQKEISIAQEIISTRNALSILSNVLLVAEEGSVTIKATDLKVNFKTDIPADVAEEGDTTVFCDKLLGILRSLPEGDVEFELTDGRVVIRPLFKKIDFQLKSIAGDKFPEFQELPDENFFEFTQKEFIEMIGQTIFAVSDDETRYFMNGVYLEKKDGGLSMVATDGRRLSYIEKVISGEIPDFEAVIVPPKILQLVRKLASGEGNVKVAVGEKSIFIRLGNQRISSSLIEGQFPNYKRVIPEQQDHFAEVNRATLEEALKRVSLLVEQKSRRIYVQLSEGTLTLFSEESEIGAAKEELDCSYMGESITIALNYLYLLEPLKIIEEDDVVIRFSEANKAITLLSKPEKDFFHIVMPMQLD
ncbi:MAG: DNA polymerase III subunit beta [Sediminispirochaetaceae bacterium]